ncbi:hypothetical protein CALVIDRAFT_524022 [Calocera viscosa TUFC12733]|uniref:Uncharacterized protein n=1 Tax=Calocera viscosa (strain TUFC12733) TaxID=1330018 RepID=A0A167S8E4_CALVF|nr:hypothetical protein CALVIDRAFT_524022 [Calocera viscosa TUFC12733]
MASGRRERIWTPWPADVVVLLLEVQAAPGWVAALHCHTNLSASFLGKLRRDVARAVNPPPKGRTRLVADSPDQLEGRKPEAKLHIIRPAILTALLRQKSPHLYPIHSVLKGPVAALAYPTLDPPVLASLLRVLDRAIPRNYVPPDTGRKKKLPPRLQLLAALIGDQVMYEPAIRATATLPTLDTLRSQIVGLLSGSAGQIRGVLDAARGGRQVGLLQSYAKGLEEKA